MSEAILTEDFPKFMLHTKPQIQEAQKTSSRINALKKRHPGISFSNYRKTKIKKS